MSTDGICDSVRRDRLRAPSTQEPSRKRAFAATLEETLMIDVLGSSARRRRDQAATAAFSDHRRHAHGRPEPPSVDRVRARLLDLHVYPPQNAKKEAGPRNAPGSSAGATVHQSLVERRQGARNRARVPRAAWGARRTGEAVVEAELRPSSPDESPDRLWARRMG